MRVSLRQNLSTILNKMSGKEDFFLIESKIFNKNTFVLWNDDLVFVSQASRDMLILKYFNLLSYKPYSQSYIEV